MLAQGRPVPPPTQRPSPYLTRHAQHTTHDTCRAINEVYTLIVVSRAAVRAQMTVAPLDVPGMNTDVAGLAPTWADLKSLYDYVYAEQGLVIPDAAIAALESHTFRELSGCPAQCSWHAAELYPSGASKYMVIPSVRTGPESCATPSGYNASATELVLVAPTALDATQFDYCNANWNIAFQAFKAAGWCAIIDGNYRSFCSRNMTASVEMARDLKGFLASTSDPVLQAVYFRYFLSFGCQGNYNTLFTGNGYTAAGVGGLLAGEATEWVFSAFDAASLPSAAVDFVQFCLGINGGVPSPDCQAYATAKP